jgi:hypothetical protein
VTSKELFTNKHWTEFAVPCENEENEAIGYKDESGAYCDWSTKQCVAPPRTLGLVMGLFCSFLTH